jgi:hypothetical protein
VVNDEVPVDSLTVAEPPDIAGTTLDVAVQTILQHWPPNEPGDVRAWLVDALSRAEDPTVFERSVELLLSHPDARGLLGDAFVELMVQRAAPCQDPRAAYVAAVALEALVSLLLESDVNGRRLDAAILLRNAPSSADLTWAQAASRMAGLAYAHWDDQALRAALKQGLDTLCAHVGAGGDAAVERAHLELLDALAAPDRDTLNIGLRDAERRFAAAGEAEEDRVDADLMASVLRAVRGFGLGGSTNGIEDSAVHARELLRERALYGRPEALPLLSRRGTEATWGRLVDALSDLAGSLDASVWTHGARIANLLLEAIEASAAVRIAPGTDHDATAAVVPRIDAALIRNMAHRQMLASVVEQEEIEPSRRDAAMALLARVESASGPDDALAALLGADLAAFEEALGPAAAGRVRQRAELLVPARAKARDVQWWESYEEILEGLADAPDFSGDHAGPVRSLIADLLDFVSLCARYQLNFGGDILKYLGEADAHESRMADHLTSWLETMGGWPVSSEVPNEGSGGRVDVRVAFGADRFIIECKRDRTPVASGAVDPYLSQADRYLGTSLRIGALAILDLSPKALGPVRGLDTSAWVADVEAADPAGPTRKVVCIVIPGNRAATPSVVGKNTPKAPVRSARRGRQCA